MKPLISNPKRYFGSCPNCSYFASYPGEYCPKCGSVLKIDYTREVRCGDCKTYLGFFKINRNGAYDYSPVDRYCKRCGEKVEL